jgi:15-cis-phytoene synthase
MTLLKMSESVVESIPLPRPFFEDGWPRASQEAARACWAWHLALRHARVPGLDGSDLAAFLESEALRVESGEPTSLVAEPVWSAAHQACGRQGLPRTLLAEQVRAVDGLRGRVRFRTGADLDAFVTRWAGSHARMLAHLADAAHSWQVRYVDELARGFFVVGRLIELKADLGRDRLYIPEADLEQAGVSFEQLVKGGVDESVRKLLWKQVIRARDAFAHGMPLVNEIAPRFGRALKRWWLGGLEMLNEIERRDYDVWSRPVTLSPFHRIQVNIHAKFARATFRNR